MKLNTTHDISGNDYVGRIRGLVIVESFIIYWHSHPQLALWAIGIVACFAGSNSTRSTPMRPGSLKPAVRAAEIFAVPPFLLRTVS